MSKGRYADRACMVCFQKIGDEPYIKVEVPHAIDGVILFHKRCFKPIPNPEPKKP